MGLTGCRDRRAAPSNRAQIPALSLKGHHRYRGRLAVNPLCGAQTFRLRRVAGHDFVDARSRVSSIRDFAVGFCRLGSFLRNEVSAHARA